MKLSELCHAPCYLSAPNFLVPAPGANKERFVFAEEAGRKFYAILPRNHEQKTESSFNPVVAVVGLSPAKTQIDSFVDEYRQSTSYDTAARYCSFRGLSKDIIEMFDGLGVSKKLGLQFVRRDTLDGHPDVWTTSLVKCASLTSTDQSSDFDPSHFKIARTCMTERFVPELLNPQFSKLQYIFILGKKGWAAIDKVERAGRTIRQQLLDAGKSVLNLPHPSGENGEYVALTKLPGSQFPSCEEYVERRWQTYRKEPPRKGRAKQSESSYKQKRRTTWMAVANLRKGFE